MAFLSIPSWWSFDIPFHLFVINHPANETAYSGTAWPCKFMIYLFDASCVSYFLVSLALPWMEI
jgi:hypothetical protein